MGYCIINAQVMSVGGYKPSLGEGKEVVSPTFPSSPSIWDVTRLLQDATSHHPHLLSLRDTHGHHPRLSISFEKNLQPLC